jgi:hypothetical protein
MYGDTGRFNGPADIHTYTMFSGVLAYLADLTRPETPVIAGFSCPRVCYLVPPFIPRHADDDSTVPHYANLVPPRSADLPFTYFRELAIPWRYKQHRWRCND